MTNLPPIFWFRQPSPAARLERRMKDLLESAVYWCSLLLLLTFELLLFGGLGALVIAAVHGSAHV